MARSIRSGSSRHQPGRWPGRRLPLVFEGMPVLLIAGGLVGASPLLLVALRLGWISWGCWLGAFAWASLGRLAAPSALRLGVVAATVVWCLGFAGGFFIEYPPAVSRVTWALRLVALLYLVVATDKPMLLVGALVGRARRPGWDRGTRRRGR